MKPTTKVPDPTEVSVRTTRRSSRGSMRCLQLLSFYLIPALALVNVKPSLAQDPPDAAMGMTPQGTYHSGDFDFVDMTTGRLNLHIPLVVDHSQRGNLNFTYSLTYTSTGAWTSVCVTIQCLNHRIVPPKYGVSSPVYVNDGTLSTPFRLHIHDTSVDPAYNANIYWVYEGGWGIGTAHPISGAVGKSIDGSGISASVGNCAGPAGNVVTSRKGVQFDYPSPCSSYIEDANGNEWANSTDTLGRSWNSAGSTVTGCPTGGPVAPSSSVLLSIPGPANINGGVRTIKLCYSVINVQTSFNYMGYVEYSGNATLLSGIVLSDGTTWRFDYDNSGSGTHFGDLTAVYPPTGGHISYTWATSQLGCGASGPGDVRVRTVATRTVYDGTNSNTWTYTLGSPTNTIKDPLGNDTAYTYFFTNTSGCLVSQVQAYSGTGNTRTLLKTTAKSYLSLPNPFYFDLNELTCDNPNPTCLTQTLLQSTTTTWANGQQSQDLLTYDSALQFGDGSGGYQTGNSYTSSYGLVLSESHSDYGNPSAGPVLSKTNTTYQALSGPNASSYLAANILELPSSVIVTDGSTPANVCAETDYGYDESSADPSGVTMQHVSAPNSVRGNLTSVTQQLFTNPCSSPNPSKTPLTTTKHVYDTGMIHTSTDPRTNMTTYAYSPTFYGAYVTQTTFPPTNSPNPANHIISGNYDFNTGLLTGFTDQNNNTTNYTYDVMLRPTNVTYASPDGGQTNFNYANPTTVEMKKSIDGTRWTDSFVYYDGLGRESRSMSINDEASPYDQVDTCYDADGRISFKSYPYQGNGTSTPKVCSGAGDAFLYDPLNRVTQVTHSDNSTVLTSYTGRATSVQDEGNGTQRVQRISQVDGLGRLASICEVSSATQLGTGGTALSSCGQDIAGPGFLTTYTYDALSNLTSVSQGGYLPRSFAYDSLSRLVTAANPEAGTTTYKYDSDTNCSVPNSFATLLVSKVDARGIRTCMRYDALNRLTQKNYSDSTPAASFNFDETLAYGVALANTTGRASSEATASPNPTGEVFSYDKLGRVRINSQCTPQNCNGSTVFPITYTYDLLGDTLTATNGMGVTLTYPPYNRALRLMAMTSSLSDANHPGTLLSSPHYNAAGSVTSASIGNPGSSVSETRSYDGRLRLMNITDGPIYSVTIPTTNGYAPNGNILQAIDSANTTWSYSYDEMNRLCNANHSSTLPQCHQSATITYGYDRFGNMWQGDGGLSISFTGNNNRIDGLNSHYDAAGNLLYDGLTTYTYDSENRIISATNASGTSSYMYDVAGRRIRKTTPSGGTVDFLYDLGGHEIAQVTSAGSWTRGEVYAGGRHLATYSGGTGGTTVFNFSDWLGTERARSAPGATTACETISSLPFGDGMATNGSCGDPSPMHFTGKERDSESGLDNFGARYDSSQYGRFMTPDPLGGHPEDPQTLNRYSYVRNNPLSLTDPTGLDFYIGCGNIDHSGCTQVQIDRNNKNKTWVQADKNGNATVITSDSIRAGQNTATVDERGVQINEQQGIYFDNPASHTTDANGSDVNHNPIDVEGSGKLDDFTIHINGNCSGTCLSSGTWTYNGASGPDPGLVLLERGAFKIPGEDILSFFGGGEHPQSDQYRLGGPGCQQIVSCPNSPHISIPYDPKAGVPGFHVDAHGDWLGHAADVRRQSVE